MKVRKLSRLFPENKSVNKKKKSNIRFLTQPKRNKAYDTRFIEYIQFTDFPIKDKKIKDDLKQYKETLLSLMDKSILQDKEIKVKIGDTEFVIKTTEEGKNIVKKFKTTTW